MPNEVKLSDIIGAAVSKARDSQRAEMEALVDEKIKKVQFSTAGTPTGPSLADIITASTQANLATRGAHDPNDRRGLNLARFARLATQTKGDSERAARFAKDIMEGRNGQTADPSYAEVHRALSSLSPSAGGFLVPAEFVTEIIPLLRDKAVVRKAGARVMPMNSGTMEIPKLSAAALASYGGENAVIAASQESFGNLSLTARKLTALVPVSNDLLRYASLAVDQMIRDDMLMSIALKEDVTFIRGDGSANTPTGILFTPGVQTYLLATNGAAIGQDDPSKAIQLAMEAHSLFQKPAWLMNSATWRALYTLKTGISEYIFREEMKGGTLEGFPFYITNQIPKNLAVGSSGNVCSEMYFGDFDEFVIGEADTLTIDASNEAAYVDSAGQTVAAFSRDQTIIRGIVRHDCAIRQAPVFVVIKGIIA